MSRVLFSFLLVAIAVPSGLLQAEEPLTGDGTGILVLAGSNTQAPSVSVGQATVTSLGVVPENNANSAAGSLSLSGSNTYSGGTAITTGALTFPVGAPQPELDVNGYQLLRLGGPAGATVTPAFPGPFNNAVGTGVFTASPGPFTLTVGGISTTGPTQHASAVPQPGPVFYIITEGAGLGDNVRIVPCTGKQTVLDAIGHVGGLSQISSTKIWIARPSAADHDKSTILNVDWEAISKHGINTTNFTLMPGDRLVVGEDSEVKRNNMIAKKTSPVERIDGIVGLSSSTLDGLGNLSPADRKLLREFVRKGIFTDDEEFKRIILDSIDASEQGNKKAGAEEAKKAGGEQDTSNGAHPKIVAKAEPVQIVGGNFVVKLEFANESEKKSNTADVAPPHELAMQPLPDYRIEPPDVIQIEMLKLVPLQPYKAAIDDVLQIRANALPDQPIDNYYIVQTDDSINLGPTYGKVRVAGMTVGEIKTTLDKWLQQWLRDPMVSVDLARHSGLQPVSGQYLVGLDGTINLRKYGRVCLMGKTIAEARSAIEKQLAAYLKSPEVAVDVAAFNSKVYYVITQGAGLGDNVRRLPITGKETVLDAIGQVNGLSQISSRNIRIVRPSAADPEKRILHVDWDAISRRGETASNFQIFPGDRIYVDEDLLVTRSNLLSKKTAPIERLCGILGLTSSTLRGLNGLSAADCAALKELVQKGKFTDDEEIKGILLEAIRQHDVAREKAPSKEGEKSTPRQ